MAIKNLTLDPLTNDLTLTTGRNLAVVENAEDALAQKLATKLRMFAGEWFLDRSLGVPFYESILKKNVDINNVNTIFRAQILTTPGVAEIVSFETELDRDLRKYTINFTVRTTAGQTVVGGVII